MTSQKAQLIPESSSTFLSSSLERGFIVGVEENGAVLVNYAGNQGPAIQADVLASAVANLLSLSDQDLPHPALIATMFPRPIVVGLLHSHISRVETHENQNPESFEYRAHASTDGERVLLEAENEIVLRCGKSTITLRKDGRITLRGVNLTSRASQTNKLKGNSVNIN